jgi:hypothetical protein
MRTGCSVSGSVTGNTLEAACRGMCNTYQFWNLVTHNVLLRGESHTCHSCLLRECAYAYDDLVEVTLEQIVWLT